MSDGNTAAQSKAPHCPACSAPLVYEQGDFHAWVCSAGHGVAATIPVARQKVSEVELTSLWRSSESAARDGRPCPFCSQPMSLVDLKWDHSVPSVALPSDAPPESVKGHVPLELCRIDQAVWFDAGELEALPAQTRPQTNTELPLLVNHLANATDDLPDYRVILGAIHSYQGMP